MHRPHPDLPPTPRHQGAVRVRAALQHSSATPVPRPTRTQRRAPVSHRAYRWPDPTPPDTRRRDQRIPPSRLINSLKPAGHRLAAVFEAVHGVPVLLLEAGGARALESMAMPPAWPTLMGSSADW